MQDLQQVLWAKGEGIEQLTRLDHLKRTWKRLYRPRRMMKKLLSPILRYPWYTPFTMFSRVARTGRTNCSLKLWGA